MKIAIISDIHGNYEALTAVLSELDNMNITEIFCLGDVVGYYSQVNECCDELRKRNISSLMGNHDWYMASGSSCLRSKSVNDCISYQRKIITPENLNWVRNFKILSVVDNIRMVHGGWGDPIDEYLKASEKYFSHIEGEIFFSGHSHVQVLHKYGKKTYCNPGSVGQPRDNDPRSAFAIFDGKEVTLHRVKYDFTKVFELMDKAGFNDYYYGCLKTGARNLCKLS